MFDIVAYLLSGLDVHGILHQVAVQLHGMVEDSPVSTMDDVLDQTERLGIAILDAGRVSINVLEVIAGRHP